jgi:hypothetical protein
MQLNYMPFGFSSILISQQYRVLIVLEDFAFDDMHGIVMQFIRLCESPKFEQLHLLRLPMFINSLMLRFFLSAVQPMFMDLSYRANLLC